MAKLLILNANKDLAFKCPCIKKFNTENKMKINTSCGAVNEKLHKYGN